MGPSSRDVNMRDINKIKWYQTTTEHNKMCSVCVFPEMYYIYIYIIYIIVSYCPQICVRNEWINFLEQGVHM